MKKKFLFTICTALCLTLTACGGNKNLSENNMVETEGTGENSEEMTEVDIQDILPEGKFYFQTLHIGEAVEVEGNNIEIVEGEENEAGLVLLQAKLNNQVIDVDYSYPYDATSYIIYNDNNFFVAIAVMHENDNIETYIYKSTNGKFSLADVQNGFIEGTIENELFSIITQVDVLGTYLVNGQYELSSDGKFILTSNLTVRSPEGSVPALRFAKDITIDEVEFKKGDKITAIEIDTINHYFYFSAENGDIHFLSYEENTEQGWGVLIDGVSESEIFENIPYAG